MIQANSRELTDNVKYHNLLWLLPFSAMQIVYVQQRARSLGLEHPYKFLVVVSGGAPTPAGTSMFSMGKLHFYY